MKTLSCSILLLVALSGTAQALPSDVAEARKGNSTDKTEKFCTGNYEYVPGFSYERIHEVQLSNVTCADGGFSGMTTEMIAALPVEEQRAIAGGREGTTGGSARGPVGSAAAEGKR